MTDGRVVPNHHACIRIPCHHIITPGNRILRALLKVRPSGTVFPGPPTPDDDAIPLTARAVHPTSTSVEGVAAYPSIAAVVAQVPAADVAVSVVTPPVVSTGVVTSAVQLGVQHVWCQEGASDDSTVAAGRSFLIHSGPCLLVALHAGPLD